MQNPIFTDSETDNSIDAPCTLNEKVKLVNTTRSVFNITLESSILESKETTDVAYENRLSDEIKEWGSIFRREIQNLKDIKGRSMSIDISILPEDKRTYISNAPDLHKFIRDSREFREAANLYLEKDYAELKDIYDNLLEICNHYLNWNVRRKIASSLSQDFSPKTRHGF